MTATRVYVGQMSFENRGDNDLIQNIVRAKEMAKEVIQIASARSEAFYNE
jgi:hypothetical protein